MAPHPIQCPTLLDGFIYRAPPLPPHPDLLKHPYRLKQSRQVNMPLYLEKKATLGNLFNLSVPNWIVTKMETEIILNS